MPTYEYDIRGYKSKKYKSLTELRRNYMKSDVAKKYGTKWVKVMVKRADGTDDYVGMISEQMELSPYGIWIDVIQRAPIYLIDKNGKLRKIRGWKYPKRYNAYPHDFEYR